MTSNRQLSVAGPWFIAVLGAWMWTWVHLSIEWRLNPQYEFGFAVPVLAAMIAWSRLNDFRWEDLATGRSMWIKPLTVAGGICLLLGEFIRQADPTWRITGWLLQAGASLMTFAFLKQLGGVQLSKCLAPAVLFMVLAVPWPSFVEVPLTNHLMRFATKHAVDLLNWEGVAALQRGNVIELSHDAVGIDEACSGIQSFLSSLMASIFLGVYLRFNWRRKLGLLATGFVFAILGNIARIIVLTKAVQTGGQAAFQKAHDPVGMVASTVIFLGLGLAAWVLRPRQPVQPAKITLPKVIWDKCTGWPVLAVVLSIPLLAMLSWQAVAGKSDDVLRAPHWSTRTDLAEKGWQVKEEPFTQEEQRLLQFTEGGAWVMQAPNGVVAYLVHLFWSPDRTIPSQAFGHSIQICLPSSGWKQLGDTRPLNLTVNSSQISGILGFYAFDNERQAVFQATWRGASYETHDEELSNSRFIRLQSLKAAYLRRGHETLTVFLPAEVVGQNPEKAFSLFLEAVMTRNTQAP